MPKNIRATMDTVPSMRGIKLYCMVRKREEATKRRAGLEKPTIERGVNTACEGTEHFAPLHPVFGCPENPVQSHCCSYSAIRAIEKNGTSMQSQLLKRKSIVFRPCGMECHLKAGSGSSRALRTLENAALIIWHHLLRPL